MNRKLLVTIQALVMLYLPAQAFAQTPEPSDIAKLRDLIEGRLSQVYGQDIHKKITFMMRQTRTGDTASGVEIVRTNDTLSIDVTPCAPEKTIFTFVKPYKETAISDTRCAEKPYPRLQVIQE